MICRSLFSIVIYFYKCESVKINFTNLTIAGLTLVGFHSDTTLALDSGLVNGLQTVLDRAMDPKNAAALTTPLLLCTRKPGCWKHNSSVAFEFFIDIEKLTK